MPIIDFVTSHWVLMILLSVATIINFLWLFFNRKTLKMNILILIAFSLLHTIIGVLFVILFAYVETGFNPESLGNMSLYGGVFFMPIVYLLYALIMKITIKQAFDVFTISLISTLFFARINCLIAGCCEGVLIGESGFRVPTREIELFYYLLFIIIFFDKIIKNKMNGFTYPIYMVSYGILRFVLEFLRESDSSSAFHVGHIWSLISIVIGGLIICILYFYRGKANENKEKNFIV